MIRRLIERLQDDRGFITPMVVVLVPALILVIGLVVDGGGKINAEQEAHTTAQSAARAAANALSTQAINTGGMGIDPGRAAAAAQSYLNAAGVNGSVSVNGRTVEVVVTTNYPTKFVSAIGISSLPIEASATAQILNQ